MTAKRVAPQNKKTSTNYSLEARIIDELHEKAELAGLWDSSYLNAILKEKFGWS